MIKVIKSNRYFENWPSWDIVHEWEDIISNQLDIPIYYKDNILKVLSLIPIKKVRNKLSRIYVFSRRFNNYSLVFHIAPLEAKYQVAPKDIPIVLDVWGHIDLNNFNNTYSHCKIVYVTSKEVYNFLQNKVNFKIKYIPVTLPNQYYLGSPKLIENQKLINKKDIDIIQIGRGNNILDDWTKSYISKYPQVHLVFQEVIGDRIFMRSNKFGLLFERKDRSQYFELLKRSKVSLYSSAGIDNGYERTGGFNALTPRLLESLSQFNYIVGRYADNVEYEPVRNKIDNCQSFESFEENMNRYLNEGDTNFLVWSSEFLQKYLTSVWFEKYIEPENDLKY